MIAETEIAFVIVEQHSGIALSLTEDAVVIERGQIVHRARSAELAQDKATLDRLIGLRIKDEPEAAAARR